MAGLPARSGIVAEFDEHAGFGTIRSDADGCELFFHCTQIVGDSRTIAVGASVGFEIVAGHGGRWEATRVEEH